MGARRYGRYRVETENLDKVLFPRDGITKGELVEYYDEIADVMLPGLRDRPLSLRRYPDGIEEEGFFQKRVPGHFPKWVRTVRVPSEDGELEQVVCQNRGTLAYLANQACIELHPWLSRAARLDHPDQLVLDLDPTGEDFEPVRRAAIDAGELLDELGLAAFVRTTGGRGLHVVAPLDGRAAFDDVRELARGVAEALASRAPEERTTEVRKAKRAGRVFVDWLRNGYAQTAVASYSVRARPGAPVATPITWEELGERRMHAQSFHLRNVRERLSQPDPWSGMRRRAASARRARERLEGMGRAAGG
jgi:bifunctional non-homologous end joining protein LigD